MTISPAQVEAEAEALRRLYAEIEEQLILLIATRLVQGIDSPRWAVEQLSGVRAIQQAIQAEVARLDAAGSAQLGTIVQRAYLAGIEGALDDLLDAGFERSSLVRAHVTAAQAFVREAEMQLRSTHLAILRQTEDAFRQAVAEGARVAVGGGETRKQAAQRVLDRLADRGITGFVDKAGRNWSVDTYAEMATRTALGRAAVQAYIDTQIANGNDLVLVSNSPEPCPICIPWEGKVLSLTGATTGTVTMAGGVTARIAGTVQQARDAGVWHPNCTHRLTTFVPGYTKPLIDEPNPERYEQRQYQRYLERGIRQWKRRQAAAMDEATKAHATAKVREWQARMREHVATHDRKRLYAREQIARAH